MSRTKLLVVEDAFRIEGRGVIVTPNVPLDAYHGPRSTTVTLRRLDGQEKTATAMFEIPRVNLPPAELYYLCLIADATKEDIPIGTEILLDEPAPA